MTKRILLSIACVLLSAVLIISSCYVCFHVIGIESAANVTLDEGEKEPQAVSPLLPLGGTTSTGFDIAPTEEKAYKTYGNAEAIVKNGALVGYKTSGYTFDFDVSVSSTIVDNIFCNGKNIASKYYESGDMYPDIILMGNNTISVVYGEDGLLRTLMVNDGYYSAEHDEEGRVIGTYFGEKPEGSYEYNADGYIVKEKKSDGSILEYTYIPSSDSIQPKASLGSDPISVSQQKITFTYENATYEYIFDYEYNGERYLTSITKNGNVKISYSYVNGSVAAAKYGDGSEVNYILDPDLNQIGMICDGKEYYFVYDTVGNIYCILDENGTAVSFYELSAYGMPVVTSVLGGKNTVLNGKNLIDEESGAIITPSKILFTKCDTVASLSGEKETTSAGDSMLLGADNVYCQRGAIPFELAIRAKVIEEAIYYLESQGYATVSNVSIVDENENHVGFIDLYILNSMCASQSLKNVFAGDRIYTLVSSLEDIKEAKERVAEYAKEENKYSVEFFELYTPVVGDIVFEGQFVYFDYLINYSATDDGIIIYKVLENDRDNYNNYNNIYNYDTSSYAVFSDDTFELSDWDYTKLIPGLNREQYDIVETYISEALQICSATSFDEVGYFDQSYYDSYVNAAMGDTLDVFVDLDPSAMVVLSEDGGITVKAVPFWEQTSVRKQICRTVGKVVLATAVAGIISIAVPGSGVVMVAILKGAIISGLKSAGLSLVVSIGVDMAKEHLLGQEINETIEERLLRYATTAANAYSGGVLLGAVAGNMRYRKFFKATGDTLSSNITPSQRMQMKLDALDSKYSGGLLDDSMAARSEYESMRLTIQSTNYSSGKIAKNVIISSKDRSSWLKKTMKVFGKAVPWKKLIAEEG